MANTNEKILNALNDYNKGLQTKLNAKFVSQVEGKSLSTNDFTDAEKTKLAGLSNPDLSGYVQKVSGKTLSTNDFTNDYRTKLDALSTETKTVDLSGYVKKDGAKVLSTNDFTDELKTKLEEVQTIYAKKTDVASALKYRGTVADFDSIPSDTTVGDVWNISVGGGADEHGITIKSGDNVAKTSTGFDVLAGAVDLSAYVEKVSGKTLSTNDFTNDYRTKLDDLDTSVFVTQVTGKTLTSNDFTDELKAKLDSLSTDTSVGGLSIYIGSTQPEDTSVIWFDTSNYE